MKLAGSVIGLLGDFDGDPLNDLRLHNGTRLAANTPATYLHDAYADSWRISDSQSYFTYASGQSTATFTDKSFPRSIVTRGDFTAAEQSSAMSLCQAYSVPAGPAFDDCVLDVLATGNWAFAAAAARIRVPSVVAGDAVVDALGYVGEDFESDIPNNFNGIRFGDESVLTAFAGPFSGSEQFRFYVPMLPGHDQATVSYDLLRLGTWPTNGAVSLKIDDVAVATPVDWSTAQSGTLPNRTPYKRIRVTVPVQHHLSQLAATFTATGLAASLGQGFAIDDVAVSLNLVPAQSFDVPLVQGVSTPLDVRTGQVGAGTLESRGAVDRYRLTVAAGSDLYLDWSSSSTSLGWRLLSSTGASLGSGSARDGDARLPGLPTDVVLEVFATGSIPPVTQQYTLAALWVPAPQPFALDLLSGPVTTSNGVPAVGAGNLETKASVDEYTFTVPAGGSRTVIDFLSADFSYATWSLLDSAGVVVRTDTLSTMAGRRFDQVLPAGEYRWRLVPQHEQTGRYSMRFSKAA